VDSIGLKKLVFLRHFRTRIEKDKPPSYWNLDDKGFREMQKMIMEGRFEGFNKIISSTEMKAKVIAKAISEKYNTLLEFSEDIVEVNRGHGFIDDDYEWIVERYLSEDEGFEYPWEDLSSVRSRARRFVELLEEDTGNILVISHGLFLTVLLSEYFQQEPATFWKNLNFGQMLEVDYDTLKNTLSAHNR
jgi:broad specificity phosphatase PhoE